MGMIEPFLFSRRDSMIALTFTEVSQTQTEYYTVVCFPCWLFHSISNMNFLINGLVHPDFLVQFGITYSEDEELRKLMDESIPDDPPLPLLGDFRQGLVSFAVSCEGG
jgi:hypothetical protein